MSQWTRPFGTSMVLIGSATTVVAVWRLAAPLPEDGRPTLAVTLQVGVVIALGACLLAWIVSRRRSTRGGGDALVVGLVLATVAAWRAWVSGRELAYTWDQGFPSVQSAVMLLGYVVACVGLLALTFWGSGEVRRRNWGVAAVVVSVVVAGTAGLVALVVPGLTVYRQTATSGTQQPAPVPASVDHVAWRRTTGPYFDLVPGGPGFLVQRADGVEALDGRTGETAWSYGRTGAETQGLTVSPDGGTALLQWNAPDDSDTMLTFFDARTGEVRFEERGGYAWAGFHVPMTGEVYVSSDGERRLTGHSLVDGSQQWERTVPPGCSLGDITSFAHVTVYSYGECLRGTATVVVAVGNRGREVWKRRFAERDPYSASLTGHYADDEGLHLYGGGIDLDLDQSTGRTVRVDRTTGTDLIGESSGRACRPVERGHGSGSYDLIALDTGRALMPRPQAEPVCLAADLGQVLLLHDGYVRALRNADRARVTLGTYAGKSRVVDMTRGHDLSVVAAKVGAESPYVPGPGAVAARLAPDAGTDTPTVVVGLR